jgi:hypothetical protein
MYCDITPESRNSKEKQSEVNLLGNGSVNTFTELRDQQWELCCLVAVNHREVFNKRLPKTRELKPLEAVIPLRFP